MLSTPTLGRVLTWTALVPLLFLFAPAAARAAQGGTPQLTPHGPTLWVTPSVGATYVARGTLPLRDGWSYSDTCPFALRRGTRVYPAQWSPVAWDSDGDLAVVELAAQVERLPGDLAQDRIPFEVVVAEPGYPLDLPNLSAGAVAVAAATGSTWLRVVDSLGNEYYGAVSQDLGSSTSEVEVLGRAKAVYHTRGPLVRVTGPGGSPLRAGGFHAWFTVHSGSPTVELDLQWHNATVGTPDQMAPDLLFERVDLLLPEDWQATLKWPYPEQGQTLDLGNQNVAFTVVELIRDGATPHVLRQRGRLTWRMALWPDGQELEAQASLDQRGWGVVRGDVNGWQDPLAARWLAQQTLLPDLGYLEQSYTTELSATRASIEQALTDGTPYYYDGVGQMGPFHSYGTSYGGMTGGDEIDQTPGAALMWTGNPDGLVAYQNLHRMVLDRQFGWFFDASGELIEARHIVQPDGSLAINMFSNDFKALAFFDDLGFSDVPNPYAAVTPRPVYEDEMLGTNPYNGLEQHDSQHGARATWPLKVLIWGANDRMARHDLAGQASVWQMEQFEGPGGRLWSLAEWSKSYPGVAGGFDRGKAWVADAMAHWYALTEPGQRAHFDPWFEMALDTLLRLRTPMGVFYGNRDGKITDYYEFNGQFAITQWYEHAIGLHAIKCMLESWADEDAERIPLATLLVEGALAVWREGWKPGTQGTWEQQAVAPMDPSLPAYTSAATTPAIGFGGGPSNDQLAGPLAYALPYANGDQLVELWGFAQGLTGNSNPLQGLTNLYPYYLAIENRAPLLAWLQVILGG